MIVVLAKPPSAALKQPRAQVLDVSVCIANWNCRDLLRDCLASLLRSEGVRLEIVVVDNASDDGAADMTASEFSEVTLLRNGVNVGFARANNQAAALAKGDYLFFLNNDTRVAPHALARLLDYARQHPDVGIVGPRLRDGRGRVQASCRRRPTVPALLHRTFLFRWTGLFRRAYRRYRQRQNAHDDIHHVEVLMGAALLMPRSLFFASGGWDEDYTFGGEDTDLCTRVGRTHPIVFYPDAEVTHFGRASSRKHIGYAYTNTVVGIARFLRKNGTSPLSLFLYKVLLTLDAPVQWLVHALEFLGRRVRGSKRAERSRLVLRGLSHFLRHGLKRLWRV